MRRHRRPGLRAAPASGPRRRVARMGNRRAPARMGALRLLAALLSGVPAAAGLAAGDASGQVGRNVDALVGVTAVNARAEVVEWDEGITMAGGATAGQYQEALTAAFTEVLEGGPVDIDPEAPSLLLCRFRTVYDAGLVAYSLSSEYHEQLGDPRRWAVTWMRAWVGTIAMQSLHEMSLFGARCAEAFQEDWAVANRLGGR